MNTVFNKRLAIPLAAYFHARIFDPKTGYGGNIQANGFVSLRNYGAEYDQKAETLFILFDAERDNEPLVPLGIPAALADAERVPHKEPARGALRTPYPRTKPDSENPTPLVAVPDMAEGITPKEPESVPGDAAPAREFFTLLVLPEEANIPALQYNEPLTTFLRDAHRYSVYLEARSAPVGNTEPGTLTTIDTDLNPVAIVRPEPSAAAKSLVEDVVEQVRKNTSSRGMATSTQTPR